MDEHIQQSLKNSLLNSLWIEGVAAKDIAKDIAEIIKIISKYFDIKEILGGGSRGTATLLDNNRQVLKITSDRSEATAASIIKKNPHPNVYKIYDVFYIGGRNSPIFDKYFGILQEKLEKLSNTEYLITSKFFGALSDRELSELYFVSHRYIYSSLKKYFKGYSELTRPKLIILDNLIEDVQNATKHLRGKGIIFVDFVVGNILKRKSDFVLIDFGYSQSAGEITKMLENNKR